MGQDKAVSMLRYPRGFCRGFCRGFLWFLRRFLRTSLNLFACAGDGRVRAKSYAGIDGKRNLLLG